MMRNACNVLNCKPIASRKVVRLPALLRKG
jgi:hypothetical protein